MQIITHLGTLLSFCCVYLHGFLWNTPLESVWRYKEHLGANPHQNISLKRLNNVI
jgi:hypothetical protein